MGVLLHIATFVVIMTTLFILQWHAAKARAGEESQSVFVYSWPAKLFGIITVSILPFVILDLAENRYLRLGMFALEAVLVCYVVAILTTRILLKSNYVEVSSAFRTEVLQFSDISGIEVSESSQCYLFHREGKKTVRISFYIVGVKTLIAAIEQRQEPIGVDEP